MAVKGDVITCRRVICILAHVDHGKTSIADCLLTLAGLVSAKATGQTRYLDNRADERQKGITMKMSAITLNVEQRTMDSLTRNHVTVLDTPGHVDFSSEVIAAAKSCDGALIIVDIAEGIRPQTTEAVKIAVQQRLKMILVINKMDRAFLEMRLTHIELYPLITGIIETLNAIMAEECKLIEYVDKEIYLNEAYFKADSRNVILASALDGWGVVAEDLVKLFTGGGAEDDKDKNNDTDAEDKGDLHNETTTSVMDKLLDPNYADAHEVTVISGARERVEVCLYASLVLQSLGYVYKLLVLEPEDCSKDKLCVNRLAQRFGLRMTPEMKGSEPRALLKTMLTSFAPLGNCIVNATKYVVPDARQISRLRMRQLVDYDAHMEDRETRLAVDSMIAELELSKTYRGVNEGLDSNDSNMFPQIPIFAYVSKMIAADIAMIVPAQQRTRITARAREETQVPSKLSQERKSQMAPIVYPKEGRGNRRPKKPLLASKSPSTGDQSLSNNDIGAPSAVIELLKPPGSATLELTFFSNMDDSETDILPSSQQPPHRDIFTAEAAPRKAKKKRRADRKAEKAVVLAADRKAEDTAPSADTKADEATALSADRKADEATTLSAGYKDLKLSGDTVKVQPLAEELQAKEEGEEERMAEMMAKLDLDQYKVIAITRVYYGILEVGDELFLITNDYKPGQVDVHTLIENRMTQGICKFKITALYILMGQNVIETKRVSAGYICGVGGLDNVDVRMGTIVRDPNYFPVHEPRSFDAVVRSAITPVHPRDSAILQRALKWLSLTDSAVRVSIQDNGQVIVHSTGDVHLSKVMEDLRMLADIPVEISKPQVWLRESVVAPISTGNREGYQTVQEKSAKVEIEQYGFEFSVFVVPIPDEAAKVLAENYATLTAMEGFEPWGPLQMRAALERNATLQPSSLKEVHSVFMQTRLDRVRDLFFAAIQTALDKHSHHTEPERRAIWQPDWYGSIWSVGKMNITEGTNVLINDALSYDNSIFRMLDETNSRALVDTCVVNAFDQVIQAGPICGEPMTRCAFVVQKLEVMEYGTWGSAAECKMALTRITSAIRDTMIKAILKQQCCFWEPMLIAEIKINTKILGRIFSVIKRRRGTVTNSLGMDVDEKSFQVSGLIPVSESDGFANAIREATHGEAHPYLRFSHFEMGRGDPMFDASKELENDDDEQLDNNEHAIALRDEIRKRKGLFMNEQAQAAEKQRTAKKK